MTPRDDCLAALREWHQLLGKTPGREAYRCSGWNPSVGIILGQFGSWAEACRQAGLTPNTKSHTPSKDIGRILPK